MILRLFTTMGGGGGGRGGREGMEKGMGGV